MLDINEYKLLNPDYYKIDEQSIFDKNYNYEYIYKYGDAWNNNNESLHNLIRQLNSLQSVFNLTKDKKYDYYLILRPDLLYNKKIDIQIILENLNTEHIMIPNFGWNKIILDGSNKQLNDRFAFGTYKSIEIYCNRINYIKLYFEKLNIPLHSESFVYFIMNYFNINYKLIDFNAQRIRSNGIIEKKIYI
jgi:hypothetical protein